MYEISISPKNGNEGQALKDFLDANYIEYKDDTTKRYGAAFRVDAIHTNVFIAGIKTMTDLELNFDVL